MPIPVVRWLPAFAAGKNRIGFALALACVLCICIQAHAQKDLLNVHTYSGDDQLPQNSIKSIAQDDAGFIWFNTEDGLVRFDGRNFRTYNKNNTNISNNRFFQILRDNGNGKLYTLNDHQEYVLLENGKAYPELNHADNFVSFISRQRNDRKNTILRAMGSKDFMNSPLPNTYIIDTRKEQHYVCDYEKVQHYEGERLVAEINFPNRELRNFFSMNQTLWYANSDGSFTRFSNDRITNSASPLPAGKESPVLMWNPASRHTLIYHCNNIYRLLCTPDYKLSTELIFTGVDIDIKHVSCFLYDDKTRRLFIGSTTRGLKVFSKQHFQAMTFGANDWDNVYYGQALWNGEQVFVPQGYIFGKNSISKAGSIFNNKKFSDKYSILIDSKGNIWTKETEMLYRFNKSFNLTGSWHFPGGISVLYEDEHKNILIGLHKNGIYQISQSPPDTPGLLYNINGISCLRNRDKNTYWIGTGDGLYSYNISTGKLDTIPQFRNRYIRSIYPDKENEIWVTVYEEGLFLLRNNHVIHLPNDRNGYLFSAHCIVEDKKGYFWIPTNKGLFQAAKKDLLAYADGKQQEAFYLYFNKSEGFNTNEFNGGCQPCAVTLHDGTISLPSLNGLIWFQPESWQSELPDKALYIDNITVDEKERNAQADSIILPSSKWKQLKIYLSTPYFGEDNNVQIQYALLTNGTPEQWLQVPLTNEITFSTLHSGSYKLHIRKLNGFGSNNYSEKVIRIFVTPLFYETWWFRLAIVLIILVLILLYVQWRLRYVNVAKRKLEIRVAQRTRNLQYALRELESSENSLRRQTQIQRMLIASISHDIKSPMKYLMLSAQKMQELISKKNYQLLPAFNSGIQETATRIYNQLENILQFISVQLKKGEIKFAPLLLHELIEKKIHTFQDIAGLQGTQIRNHVTDDVLIRNNRELLSVILHNLLDNAVKNTVNGAIAFFTEKREGKIYLIITDTGPGFTPEMLEWINAPLYKNKEADNISEHKGMGLIIVKELLRMIHSQIIAEPGENGGTHISIILDIYRS